MITSDESVSVLGLDPVDLLEERPGELSVGRLHELEFGHGETGGPGRRFHALGPHLPHQIRFIIGIVAFKVA